MGRVDEGMIIECPHCGKQILVSHTVGKAPAGEPGAAKPWPPTLDLKNAPATPLPPIRFYESEQATQDPPQDQPAPEQGSTYSINRAGIPASANSAEAGYTGD